MKRPLSPLLTGALFCVHGAVLPGLTSSALAQSRVTSGGFDLTAQEVILYTAEGIARPQLEGTWFEQGFHGTMADLLCAIEEDREPLNNARATLDSLALCFAAVESAHCGEPIAPGDVRRLPVL